MAPVFAPQSETAMAEEGPVYVPEPSFILGSIAETPNKKSSKAKPYCPGAMLSEVAFVASAFGQQFGNPALGNDLVTAAMASTIEAHDPGVESDCSTVDTTNEAAMHMTASDGSFMMPSMGMLAEAPWSTYPDPNYWMQYQPEQTWPQLGNAGSTGHNIGRCKPCAFLYKDGCRSGNDCPYCHLCPPGEKQRRKRVMRAMQRNIGQA